MTERHQTRENDAGLFAAEFDPQPFPRGESAAQASIFKGLARAAGTPAIVMRLLVDGGLPFAHGIVDLGGGIARTRGLIIFRSPALECLLTARTRTGSR
jgi:hypothetical protein